MCKLQGGWFLAQLYILCSNILGLKNMEENIRNNSFVFGFQKDRHFLCCKTILVPKWPYIAIVFSSFTSLFLKYFMIFTTIQMATFGTNNIHSGHFSTADDVLWSLIFIYTLYNILSTIIVYTRYLYVRYAFIRAGTRWLGPKSSQSCHNWHFIDKVSLGLARKKVPKHHFKCDNAQMSNKLLV